MATRGMITIEKPWGGWASAISGTTSAGSSTGAPASWDASTEAGENQYAESSAISLFRLERFGDIAPGETFSPITDSSTHINEVAINGDVASNDRAFFVLRNNKVVRTATDGTSTTDGSAIALADTTGHTAHGLQDSRNIDLIIIKDNALSPNERVLVSWEDNVDADIQLMNTSFGGIDPDWYSTLTGDGTLVSDVPIKMIQGPDRNIYITNGQFIASAVMPAETAITSATKNTQALNLGAGYIGTGITKYKIYVAVCGHNAGISGTERSEVQVFLWNGKDPEPNAIYDIQDNFANGIFNDGNDLFVITYGRNNSTKLWKFNGGGFDLVFESRLINVSNTILQGSLENYQDSLHLGIGNRIFQLYKNGLHQRTTANSDGIAATGNQSVGMVKNLYDRQLFLGLETSAGNFKVVRQDQFTEYVAAEGVTTVDFRTRLYHLPYRSIIKGIKFYFSQFGTGASITASLFENYDTMSVGGSDDLLNKQLTNTALGVIDEFLIPVYIPDLSSFYVNIRFDHSSITNTAAIIRRIEIIYETTTSKSA